MSFVAAAGGFLLTPIVGALGSRVVAEAVKPKEVTTTLLIGSAVHALTAFAAYKFSESTRQPGLSSFAYGGAWGNGISSGLLGVTGLYGYTEPGKKMLALTQGSGSPPGLVTSSGDTPGGYASPSYQCAAPKGLLRLLTAAKEHGYT